MPDVPYADEYVCDGGDTGRVAGTASGGQLVGMEGGDTIVEYVGGDGRIETQPSNRVCVYAPRFAAVRKVYGVVFLDQREKLAGIGTPQGSQRLDDHRPPTTLVAPLQPGRYRSGTASSRFLATDRSADMIGDQESATARRRWLPYEDFRLLRRGIMDNAEKARLGERIEAAVAWSLPQSVQVVIDGFRAPEISGQNHAVGIHRYALPDGKRRLRIVKVADRRDGQSGETVAFTLRVDNVGDLPVTHVTVTDRLPPRLAFIRKSASCDRKHTLDVHESADGTTQLQWELEEPLKVGEGAVIRFRCRIR